MEEIREEIKTKLLQAIKDASGVDAVLDAIHNFNEFVSALVVEKSLQEPDTVDMELKKGD